MKAARSRSRICLVPLRAPARYWCACGLAESAEPISTLARAIFRSGIRGSFPDTRSSASSIRLAAAANGCPSARFTGWDHDGGYAEFAVVSERFAYSLPPAIDRAAIVPGMTVGLYGFGGSAHLALQVLKHWDCTVFVMSRGGIHRDLAQRLRADWIGDAAEVPPEALDAAILFAPAGNLVPRALESLDRGGVLAIAGIYVSEIPPLNYERMLFYERELRSVTANTRADGEEFLRIAGEIPIQTSIVPFELEQANLALQMLKHDELRGAAVLRVA